MNRLQGKVCVVTGAANGIGLSIAERFLAEGATVMIADLNAEQAETEAKRLGENAISWKVDVTSSESVKQMFDQAVEKFAKID